MPGVIRRLVRGLVLAVVLLILLGVGLYVAGEKLLLAEDRADPADALVALGGSFARPLYAADLFSQGRAPAVWVSRPVHPAVAEHLAPLGIDLPRQEDIYVRILEAKGAPAEAIHLFGESLPSTVAEAEALRAALAEAPKSLLVVTSAYHVGRARAVFEDAFPGVDVRVVGSPYEAFPRAWWASRVAFQVMVLELAKYLWYAAGGQG